MGQDLNMSNFLTLLKTAYQSGLENVPQFPYFQLRSFSVSLPLYSCMLLELQRPCSLYCCTYDSHANGIAFLGKSRDQMTSPIFNNYSTSALDKSMIDSNRGAQLRVCYNHLIYSKCEWNNCFIKNAPKIQKTKLN